MKISNVARPWAVLLAMVSAAPPAGAQEDVGVKPGQRVRVTTAMPGRFTGAAIGNLTNVTADNVTLFDPERGSIMELPRSSIQRLEVSQGRRRGTKKGLLVGSVIGAGMAALTWAAFNAEPVACGGYVEALRECTSGEKAAYAGVIFGVSAGIGAWVGSRKQSELWSDTPFERVKVSVRPARDGARVALAFSF